MQNSTKIQKNTKLRYGTVERDILELKNISITARYIYSLLATYAGDKTTCWPPMKELHNVSGLSIRTITYSIAELRNAGIIKTIRKKYYNIYEFQDTQPIAQLKSRYATGCVPDTQNPAFDTTILYKNKQEKEQFDEFRKIYPGKKRGNKTEFENFKKKHKDWKEVLPQLKPAILIQIKNREISKSKNEFVPGWKNLQTWINQRWWEEEIKETQSGYIKPDNLINYE